MANFWDTVRERRKIRRGQSLTGKFVRELASINEANRKAEENRDYFNETGEVTNVDAVIDVSKIRTEMTTEKLKNLVEWANEISLGIEFEEDGKSVKGPDGSPSAMDMEVEIFERLKLGLPVVAMPGANFGKVDEIAAREGRRSDISASDIDEWLKDESREKLKKEILEFQKSNFSLNVITQEAHVSKDVDSSGGKIVVQYECLDKLGLDHLRYVTYKSLTEGKNEYGAETSGVNINKIDGNGVGALMSKEFTSKFRVDKVTGDSARDKKYFILSYESAINNMRDGVRVFSENKTDLKEIAGRLGEKYVKAVEELENFETGYSKNKRGERVRNMSPVKVVFLEEKPVSVKPEEVVFSWKHGSSNRAFEQLLATKPNEKALASAERIQKRLEDSPSNLGRFISGLDRATVLFILSNKLDCEEMIERYPLEEFYSKDIIKIKDTLKKMAESAARENMIDGSGNSILLCSVETGRLNLAEIISCGEFDNQLMKQNGAQTPLLHMFIEKNCFTSEESVEALAEYLVHRNPSALFECNSEGHNLASYFGHRYGDSLLNKIKDIVMGDVDILHNNVENTPGITEILQRSTWKNNAAIVEEFSGRDMTLDDVLRAAYGNKYQRGSEAAMSTSGVAYDSLNDYRNIKEDAYRRVEETARKNDVSVGGFLEMVQEAAGGFFAYVKDFGASVAGLWSAHVENEDKKIAKKYEVKHGRETTREYKTTSASEPHLFRGNKSEFPEEKSKGEHVVTQTPTTEKEDEMAEKLKREAEKARLSKDYPSGPFR